MNHEIDVYLKDLDNEHKHNIFDILKEKELILLRNLAAHSKRHTRHSFNVATDATFLAESLGLKPKRVERIKMAALLHDVGKVYMHTIVLDAGVKLKEVEEIAKINHIDIKGKDPYSLVTMGMLVDYRSKHLSFWNDNKINSNEAEKILDILGVEQRATIREHINNHQKYTGIFLKRAGVDPQIADIAAKHHPEYLKEEHHTLDVHILATADKFNAMIQSEGIRNYSDKLSRSKALNLLAEKFKESPKVVQALAKRELLIERREIEPQVNQMINEFKSGKVINPARIDNILARLIEWIHSARILKLKKHGFKRMTKDSAIEIQIIKEETKKAEFAGRVR